MAPEDNKQAVKAFFTSIAMADPQGFRELLSDEPTWWIPESAAAKNASRLHSVPGERAVRGKDALTTMLFSSGFYRDRRSSPEYEPMRYDRHHLIAEGDMVVSHHTMHTVTSSGDAYQNEFVFVFRLEDGKIAEVWEHLDTAHSYASLGLDKAVSTD
jgi:uncharacterized protein